MFPSFHSVQYKCTAHKGLCQDIILLRIYLVADLGLRCGNTSQGQFDSIGGFKKYRGQPKRFNALAKADHLILTVAENHIDREFHKKHVDGLAMRYDQGIPCRQGLGA